MSLAKLRWLRYSSSTFIPFSFQFSVFNACTKLIINNFGYIVFRCLTSILSFILLVGAFMVMVVVVFSFVCWMMFENRLSTQHFLSAVSIEAISTVSKTFRKLTNIRTRGLL